MDRIFLDSSVIVKHCMEGDEFLTKLILEEHELATSPNVVEESFYKCLYLRTEVQKSLDFSYKFHLLPNDALIAATCKFYGIKRIATFDKDFERVDFLEVFIL